MAILAYKYNCVQEMVLRNKTKETKKWKDRRSGFERERDAQEEEIFSFFAFVYMSITDQDITLQIRTPSRLSAYNIT